MPVNPLDHDFIFNRNHEKRYRALGPFGGRYSVVNDCNPDVERRGSVFVVCPGPSLDGIDLSLLRGRNTLGVNLAGFAVDGPWVIAETRFAVWWCREMMRRLMVSRPDIGGPPVKHAYMTPRAAVWTLAEESFYPNKKKGLVHLVSGASVVRFWEDGILDDKTIAAGTLSAMLVARMLGYKTVYLVGLDLSFDGDRQYARCVPEFAYKPTATSIRTGSPNTPKSDKYLKQVKEIVSVADILADSGMLVFNTSCASHAVLPLPFIDFQEAVDA